MQSHGITLSFHREMADSSRELVGPDITATVSFESYPRFIKGGFQDYEGLGIKRSTADSKHVPSPTIEVARKQRLLEPPTESSRIFGTTWRFGRSFQIEAMAQIAIAEPNRSHSPLCLCKAPRQKGRQ
jgi:hypothetical protein